MNGPHWIKQWIADLALLNELFRNDDGSVDFEALGRDEYMFRTALITRNFKKSERAKIVYEQAEAAYQVNVERGKKGGRPRKQETTADAPTREDGEFKSDSGDAGNLESATSATHYGVAPHREAGDVSATDSNNSEARQIRRTGGSSAIGMAKVPQPPVRSLRLPTWDEFTEFIDAQGLDYTDAREWWEMTMVDRKGLDRYGKPIGNWKGALKRFCTTKTANRRTA